MTMCLDSSTGPKQTASWQISRNGCRSSGWSCTQTKRAGLSSGSLPNKTGTNEEKASPRRLILFLGFTHISGTDANRNFAVKRKTISKRMRAKLLDIKQQLRQRMHDSVPQTGKWLRSIVQGYFNYHAIPGNTDSLFAFRHRAIRLWRSMLIHRGQKHHLTWVRMQRLADRWLPQPRVLHPYPRVRFDATHPR